jgi:hypothetical protein
MWVCSSITKSQNDLAKSHFLKRIPGMVMATASGSENGGFESRQGIRFNLGVNTL